MNAWKAILISLLIFSSGCTTTKLYEGEKLPDGEIAIFHTNRSSMGPYMSWEIDDRKKLKPGLFSPKAAFLKADEHHINLAIMITKAMIPYGETFSDGSAIPRNFIYIRTYDFSVPLETGFSYQVEYPGYSFDDQKFELCLLGEPHDAEGSKVSWGHERRNMSKSAVKVQCVLPTKIITPDGKIENPEAMPRKLDFREKTEQES